MNAKDDPHFGLMLAATVNGLAVGSYREMVVVSQTAEEYGFDSVWLCDHFLTISPGEYAKVAGIAADTGSATGTETGGAGQCAPSRSLPLLECWTALAALSRDTTKLRLGTSVLCNSYRHPSVLAKMAATLDVISQGRLDLGLGAGWFRRESQAYGIPFPAGWRPSLRACRVAAGHQGRVDRAKPHLRRPVLHLGRRHLRSAAGATATSSVVDRRGRRPGPAHRR